MRVPVDAAGQDELVRSVDLAPARPEAHADRRDRLAGDAEIGAERVRRRGDRAAADHEVVGRLAQAPHPPVVAGQRLEVGTIAGASPSARETMTGRPEILVINPNSNEAVTAGLAEALRPLSFGGGPEIRCETLREGPLGIETQADVESVAFPLRRRIEGENRAGAFVLACYSAPGL